MLRGALADRLLDKPAGAGNPAPRARNRTLLLEHDRVTADRGRRDREMVSQPLHRHRAFRRLDDLHDRPQALIAAVAVGFTRAVRSPGHLTLPATMPDTMKRLRKKTIRAGTVIATI